jgi:HD-like signal output (HDOD) protein
MDIEAAIRERVRERRLRVPPVPSACLQLSSLASREDWTLAEVEPIVRADPAITAVVLRTANSASYRGVEATTRIPQAVSRLGLRGVLSLAWANAGAQVVAHHGPLSTLRLRAWRESLVAANVARWLASGHHGSPFDPETSFVVGMLHDIGRVVVISALEELLLKYPDADTRTAEGWWALVEDLHVPAGCALVEAWQLPAPLAAAVAFHHQVGAWDWLQVVNEVVAQVEATPHVSAESLGHLAALDTPTCLMLAKKLPDLVEALRLVDPELPHDSDDAAPFGPDAVCVSTGAGVLRGTLQEVDDSGLVVALEEAPLARMLVFVRVGALGFSARPDVLGHGRVRLRPWALGPEAARAFDTWVGSLGAGRPAA